MFFAHCNPHRLIIHKPSFSAALSHDKVPSYLILAVCALAAPWSKEITSRAPMPRLAGVPFFQEAVSIMFDSSGRLLSEPSLATAQALCLLEMHEVAASHSWTKHYRYFGKWNINHFSFSSYFRSRRSLTKELHISPIYFCVGERCPGCTCDSVINCS